MRRFSLILIIGCLLAISRDERLYRRPQAHDTGSEILETISISPPYFTDFEDDVSDWSIVTYDDFYVHCQWQRVENPELMNIASDIYPRRIQVPERDRGAASAPLPSAKSGSKCFWYGNPESGTFIGEPYDPGSADDGGFSRDGHAGLLVSPTIETADLEHIILSFWTWWEVECIDIDEYDLMHVLVSTDEGDTWNEVALLNPPFSRLVDWLEFQSYSSGGYLHDGLWMKWQLSLDEFVGENINVGFYFETVDMLYNGFRSWFIDDFNIAGSGGHTELDGLDSLSLVNCRPQPDTISLNAGIENIGDVTMYNVQAELILSEYYSIVSGDNPILLGDLGESEGDDYSWTVALDTVFDADTILGFEVIFTTNHPAGFYFDDFDDTAPLFTGSGTGSDRWTYQNASAAGGPSSAVSGTGIAGIPTSGTTYGRGIDESLTSEWLDISRYDACYVSFHYWMNVPDVGSLFDTRTIDGGILEIDNGSGWVMIDEFAVGTLQPRYDEYLDDIYGNPLGGTLAWSLPTWDWVEVHSQDLISIGMCSPGDMVRFRFRFASATSDAYPQGQGWFIDDFKVKSEGFDVGPFVATHSVFIPGAYRPEYEYIFPWDGAYSACDTQQIAIGITGFTAIDESRIELTVEGVTYYVDDPELSWTGSEIVFTPANVFETDCTVEVVLDSIYTVEGCSIESLEWSFYIDVTPPCISILSIVDGYLDDPMQQLVFLITDHMSGVDTNSIDFIYDGVEYNLNHAALQRSGDTLTFDPAVAGVYLLADTLCTVMAEDRPDLCSPNQGMASFPLHWSNSSVTPFYPPDSIISSCEYQKIVFLFTDLLPLDTTSVVVDVNGTEYGYLSAELSFSRDTIIFSPQVPFENGSYVIASVIEAVDVRGYEWEGEASIEFFIDTESPGHILVQPDVVTIPERMPEIRLQTADNLSGIAQDSIRLFIDGDPVGFDISLFDEGYLFSFTPQEPYIAGDTVWVELYSCDLAEICGPNCGQLDTFFVISPETGCETWPNPFTPNGDGISDIALFSFPDRFFSRAELVIFTKRGEEILRKEIDGDNIAWNGLDSKGGMAQQGLYLYIVLKDGEKVCEGTVVLVR